MTMEAHQLINQDSGNTEYYTPDHIVACARIVMGGIDLDPASSEEANKRIKAETFFSKDNDGLSLHWYGRVWMNHPFGRVQNPLWIQKLLEEVQSGRVKQACCITFAATSEQWFKPLLRRPQCFLSPRTNYMTPGGGVLRGVTKGSVVTYFGPKVEAFQLMFSDLGIVKI